MRSKCIDIIYLGIVFVFFANSILIGDIYSEIQIPSNLAVPSFFDLSNLVKRYGYGSNLEKKRLQSAILDDFLRDSQTRADLFETNELPAFSHAWQGEKLHGFFAVVTDKPVVERADRVEISIAIAGRVGTLHVFRDEANIYKDSTLGILSKQDLDIARERGYWIKVDTAFEQQIRSPILQEYEMTGKELAFIFDLFGSIDFKYVSENEIEAGQVYKLDYDDDGRISGISCSDRITAEGLIDLLGELRSDCSREKWYMVAKEFYGYFYYWSEALSKHSKQKNLPRVVKRELVKLSAYFDMLSKRVKKSFHVRSIVLEESKDRSDYIESDVQKFIEQQLGHVGKEEDIPSILRWKIDSIEEILAENMIKKLTDPFEEVLLEGVFSQFMDIVSSWDSPKLKKGLLHDETEEEVMVSGRNWIQVTRRQFDVLVEQADGDVEKLQRLHVSMAKKIAKTIREFIPEYSSGRFHLRDIIKRNKANCVGYTTMFYLIAREVGLDVKCTYVNKAYESFGDDEIHHAANILELPSGFEEEKYAVVDVTWSCYVSEPIARKPEQLTYQDDACMWLKIPQDLSAHNDLQVFANPVLGIRNSIHSWISSVDEYYKDGELRRRLYERRLRANPNDYVAFRRLGDVYCVGLYTEDGPNSPYLAIKYYRYASRLKMDYSCLRNLGDLYYSLNGEEEFYKFCEELIEYYDTPEVYVEIASVYKDINLNQKTAQFERVVSLLGRAEEKFPGNIIVKREIGYVYLNSYKEELREDEKLRQKILTYTEDVMRADISASLLFNAYKAFARFYGEEVFDRFKAFCKLMCDENPQAHEPVLRVMNIHSTPTSIIGFQKAFEIGKAYLNQVPVYRLSARRAVLKSMRSYYPSPYTNTTTINGVKKSEIVYPSIALGTPEGFLVYLRALNEEHSDCYATIERIAIELFYRREYDEAREFFAKYLEKYPYNKDDRVFLMKACFYLKDWPEVLNEAEIVEDRHHNNDDALWMKGIAFHELGKYEEAKVYFRKFLLLYGDVDWLEKRVAEAKKRLGDMGEDLPPAASSGGANVDPEPGDEALKSAV